MASDALPSQSGEVYRWLEDVLKLDGPSVTVALSDKENILIVEYWYDGVKVGKPFDLFMFDLDAKEYVDEFAYNLIVDWAMLRLME